MVNAQEQRKGKDGEQEQDLPECGLHKHNDPELGPDQPESDQYSGGDGYRRASACHAFLLERCEPWRDSSTPRGACKGVLGPRLYSTPFARIGSVNSLYFSPDRSTRRLGV